MEMYFCPLYSGSSGNALFCQYGETRLLIDAGKSGKTIEDALNGIGADIRSLSGVLITHEHSDHIAGAGVLARKYRLPLYATKATWEAMEGKIGKIPAETRREIEAGRDFYLGSIGVVPFSPIASGFLSGKVNAATDFSHSDEVRKYVPQLKQENIDANRPIIDLIAGYAESKKATNAQISLAWMLHKYPNVVPIPGSKNQGRIMENLGAWNVHLTDEDFKALDSALDSIPVHGHRGFVQMEGSRMSDWGKK